MKCFDVNNPTYQWLQSVAKAANISDFQLRAYTSQYYDKYEDFPPLDLIPNMNSELYIRQELGLSDKALYVKGDKLREFTGRENATEHQQFINNKYLDQEVSILELPDDEYIIRFRKKPHLYGDIFSENIDWKNTLDDFGVTYEGTLTKESSAGILNNIIRRLTARYGIRMVCFNNQDLATNKYEIKPIKGLPGVQTANGFIHNGIIYINTSNAKADAPLHELMHIIMGQLLENPANKKLYQTLMDIIEGKTDQDKALFNEKLDLLQENPIYAGRTRNDLKEEIIVSEFAEFLTLPTYDGMFTKLSEDAKTNLLTHITRAIDTVLMPIQSSSTLDIKEVVVDSIVGLSEKLGSALILPSNPCQLSRYSGAKHRRLANFKQDAIARGNLKEDCKP